MIVIDFEQELIPVEHKISPKRLALLSEKCSMEIGGITGTVAARGVSVAEIKRLNRIYRGHDVETDVLSFQYDQVGGLLGDIVISFEQAKRQADGDIELELIDLLTHGVLHVCGFDHEQAQDARVMLPLQDLIVTYVFSKSIF